MSKSGIKSKITSIISSPVSTFITSKTEGMLTETLATTKVKLVPRIYACLASSKPIFPEDLLVMPLTESMGSYVPPILIKIFFPLMISILFI